MVVSASEARKLPMTLVSLRWRRMVPSISMTVATRLRLMELSHRLEHWMLTPMAITAEIRHRLKMARASDHD